MWGVILAVLGMVMFGAYWFIFGEEARTELKEGQANSLAQNMLVFHGGVVNYARANQASVTPNPLVTTAIIGAVAPAIRAQLLDISTTYLQAWFVPAGAWRVAWGRDPTEQPSSTVRLVATYFPTEANNIRPIDIALGLANVTGGNPAAGIVANNGQIISPSLSGAANTTPLRVPVNDAGVPLIADGAAVVVTRITF